MTNLNVANRPSFKPVRRTWAAVGRSWGGSHPRLVAIFSLLAALVVSSAWLAFPYILEGRGLIADVGDTVQTERRDRATTVGQLLTRYADGLGGAEIDMLYATPRFFEIAGQASSYDQYRPDQYIVFMINETTHIEDLPQQLPEATLIVDGKTYQPVDIEGPIDVVHHRSSTVRFAAIDANGQPIIPADTSEIELSLVGDWGDAGMPRTASWDLPIDYAETYDAGIWTPVMVFALAAGLLSAVLTPCLLQLLAVYFVTLVGVSAESGGGSGSASASGPGGRKMLYAALAFVAGFTVLYTVAGAAIGYAGKEMQILSAEWSRHVGIASGLLIIAMAIWFGIRSRAPMVCKIPLPGAVARFDKRGVIGSALVAAGFSLGCMTCFSGAIVATLLVYVGALGSASIGALVLFLFSIGVGIPFLAGALFLSRATRAMAWVSKFSPQIGFVSMVLMAGFGVLLITDNFHEVSNLIYPWLGLG